MKKKSKSRRPRYQLCGDPNVSVVLQAERGAWDEATGRICSEEFFSDPHPLEVMHLLCEETENFVWTTVCKN